MWESKRIYPDVVLGEGAVIDDFTIIGVPAGEDLEAASIGSNARIRSHTVIYTGNRIGCNLQTGHHVMIRECNSIGDDVSIGTGSVIEHHVQIGDRVRIHSQAFVPEYSILEDDCWIGPNVVLTNAKYPASPEAKRHLKGPRIGKGAKIGANATVLPGVCIGPNALIGAGSVVTQDIPGDAVAAGNPARITGNIADLPYSKP